MFEKDTHPNLEEIMEFVAMSDITVKRENYKHTFSMVAHFAQCEKCRKIKEDMIKFNNSIESAVSSAGAVGELEMKILYSLGTIETKDKLKNREALLGGSGTITKDVKFSEFCDNTADKTKINVVEMKQD